MQDQSDFAASERWDVGPAEVIAEGGRLVVDAGERAIGIFRVEGRLYAFDNVCPHQGGPVCQGVQVDRVVEVLDEGMVARGFKFDAGDPHIVCPWHGYEFSIKTGRHPGAEDIGLTPITVEEIDGRVYINL